MPVPMMSFGSKGDFLTAFVLIVVYFAAARPIVAFVETAFSYAFSILAYIVVPVFGLFAIFNPAKFNMIVEYIGNVAPDRFHASSGVFGNDIDVATVKYLDSDGDETEVSEEDAEEGPRSKSSRGGTETSDPHVVYVDDEESTLDGVPNDSQFLSPQHKSSPPVTLASIVGFSSRPIGMTSQQANDLKAKYPTRKALHKHADVQQNLRVRRQELIKRAEAVHFEEPGFVPGMSTASISAIAGGRALLEAVRNGDFDDEFNVADEDLAEDPEISFNLKLNPANKSRILDLIKDDINMIAEHSKTPTTPIIIVPAEGYLSTLTPPKKVSGNSKLAENVKASPVQQSEIPTSPARSVRSDTPAESVTSSVGKGQSRIPRMNGSKMTRSPGKCTMGSAVYPSRY